jgi:hypothetical protein
MSSERRKGMMIHHILRMAMSLYFSISTFSIEVSK